MACIRLLLILKRSPGGALHFIQMINQLANLVGVMVQGVGHRGVPSSNPHESKIKIGRQ